MMQQLKYNTRISQILQIMFWKVLHFNLLSPHLTMMLQNKIKFSHFKLFFFTSVHTNMESDLTGRWVKLSTNARHTSQGFLLEDKCSKTTFPFML